MTPSVPEQNSHADLGKTQLPETHLGKTIDALYRTESGRVLATLVRLLGDLDLAEEAMHEAFAAALESWPRTGIPDNPRPWLISTARFKAIDVMRRRARFEGVEKDLTLHTEAQAARDSQDSEDNDNIEDDRLRLIFTCCHPALPAEAQVALTLREVCGLTTEEIARAFLVTPATLAQRIVRAKAIIRDKAIPYQVPGSQELEARLGAVLLVIYLIFNEGYSAETTGAELSNEAIRLGRLLLDLLHQHSINQPEATGLLGLMLLQESRRAARTSAGGDLILLENQDRGLWNKDQITEGIALTESALRSRRFGAYTLQAAIAAVHAGSSSTASTDWRQITLLYDELLRIQLSPVVELNRAVAVAMCGGTARETAEETDGETAEETDGEATEETTERMRGGLEDGLRLIDELLSREGVHGSLANYYLAHSARADLCRRLGRIPEARASYEKALGLLMNSAATSKEKDKGKDNARHEPERRFLARRIEELKQETSM
jgi:RNA polymerase sigma-70 factor (ECF subfamily)